MLARLQIISISPIALEQYLMKITFPLSGNRKLFTCNVGFLSMATETFGMALSVEYKSVINDSSWGSLLPLPISLWELSTKGCSIWNDCVACILDLQQHFVELLDLYEPGLRTSITSLVHIKNSRLTHLVIAYINYQSLSRRGRRLIPQNQKIPTPWQYISLTTFFRNPWWWRWWNA